MFVSKRTVSRSWQKRRDDIDGQELDLEVVRKALALEVEWYRKT